MIVAMLYGCIVGWILGAIIVWFAVKYLIARENAAAAESIRAAVRDMPACQCVCCCPACKGCKAKRE